MFIFIKLCVCSLPLCETYWHVKLLKVSIIQYISHQHDNHSKPSTKSMVCRYLCIHALSPKLSSQLIISILFNVTQKAITISAETQLNGPVMTRRDSLIIYRQFAIDELLFFCHAYLKCPNSIYILRGTKSINMKPQ